MQQLKIINNLNLKTQKYTFNIYNNKRHHKFKKKNLKTKEHIYIPYYKEKKPIKLL